MADTVYNNTVELLGNMVNEGHGLMTLKYDLLDQAKINTYKDAQKYIHSMHLFLSKINDKEKNNDNKLI